MQQVTLFSLRTQRVNFYSLDLFSDEADGRQGIIDLSVGLYPKLPEDDSEHVSCRLIGFIRFYH